MATTPSVPTATVVPEVDLARKPAKQTTAIIVGLGGGERPQLVGGADADQLARQQLGTPLLALARTLGASTKPGRVTVVPTTPLVAVVGLDDSASSPETLRRAVGAATRSVLGIGEGAVHLAIDLGVDDADQVKAVVEGAVLGGYTYAKVTRKNDKPRLRSVEVVCSGRRELKDAAAVGRTVAENVLLARDWINTPANILYPQSFAEAASTALTAGKGKVEVEVLNRKALEAGGYGGILAVGGGSERAPRLVRAAYAPRGAKFHLALVGKGITFDTGGLNLKPSDGMYTMKDDMSGAAVVLAATRAIAALGLPVRVTAYAAMAENMPSGSAYRPSDVLTMYGGTTVENSNSDAEGRLVMADALARATEDKPDLVLDVATLTGAAVVALGLRVAAVMASDDEVADMVLDAAELAGEDFWQLPIPQHLRDGLDSKVADLRSTGGRQGGALTAGAFLQRFVGDLPWAHLDIAGPAFNDDAPYDYVASGGTGFAVRTLVALAASLGR